jgi:hypothetical protein
MARSPAPPPPRPAAGQQSGPLSVRDDVPEFDRIPPLFSRTPPPAPPPARSVPLAGHIPPPLPRDPASEPGAGLWPEILGALIATLIAAVIVVLILMWKVVR